jgi:DNA invertase Pin-like site-specific DNA recombinase
MNLTARAIEDPAPGPRSGAPSLPYANDDGPRGGNGGVPHQPLPDRHDPHALAKFLTCDGAGSGSEAERDPAIVDLRVGVGDELLPPDGEGRPYNRECSGDGDQYNENDPGALHGGIPPNPPSAEPRIPLPPGEQRHPGNRAALYLRVSTEDQDLAGQERDLRLEAERRGWEVAAVYAEKVSGSGRVEREEYDRLLRDLRRPDPGWSVLLVWALDRWSREERFDRAVGAILDLEKGGVRFSSLKEPYLSTPETDDASAAFARNLLLGVTASVAHFESRRKSERVRVAMREIREGRRPTRSGRPPGRPRRVTPEKVGRIMELRRQGLKWREVAGRVGLPAGTCASVWSKARSSTPGATAPES